MNKAFLLITIPILILIISVTGLLIAKRNTNRIVKQENLKYEYYIDKIIYGTELTSIINKVVNENEKNGIKKDENNYYIENDENSIKIEVKMNITNQTYPMEEFYNNDMTEFVKNFNLINFKCTSIEYHQRTGKVKKLVFEEI